MTPSFVEELVEDNLRNTRWILVATLVVADETFYDLFGCTMKPTY
jgi:hypothetical protein